MHVSNCLIFALQRWFKHGGYFVIRKSRYGPFPHFIWCKDLKDADIEHYVPLNPKRRLIPPLFFRGEVRREDE